MPYFMTLHFQETHVAVGLHSMDKMVESSEHSWPSFLLLAVNKLSIGHTDVGGALNSEMLSPPASSKNIH